ncbi:hypothetical protein [Microbacterium sp. B19]|uniref:hypothetical protein n=1 Tax=Microbacterium sp. B19 TaxID=96765 RepID=UPI00034A1F98|nr:hypothetical protein [Microbacterium sp. B19]
MTRYSRPFHAFPGPITSDWSLAELLEWIGADDDRCHDDRLRGLLEAIDPGPQVGSGAVVVLVRSLAARVVADPALGAVRIQDALGLPEAVGDPERLLVTV